MWEPVLLFRTTERKNGLIIPREMDKNQNVIRAFHLSDCNELKIIPLLGGEEFFTCQSGRVSPEEVSVLTSANILTVSWLCPDYCPLLSVPVLSNASVYVGKYFQFSHDKSGVLFIIYIFHS